ncbi:MAG: hypothetical protein ACLUE2_02310 [Bacteroides cellulosilyticus]
MQKDEREIIPSLNSTNLVFWGRQTISSANDTPNVTLYRNLAKVTVETEATNFEVTGYVLCNYASNGTVAPFNPECPRYPVHLDRRHADLASQSRLQNRSDRNRL